MSVPAALAVSLHLQAEQLRREAAKLRALTEQRDGLLVAREELSAALAAALLRAERAEGEAASLKVGVSAGVAAGSGEA